MRMQRKRGLFGAPMADSVDAEGVPQFAKPSTLQTIAGVIGDTLSTIGGGQASFLPGLAMQRQMQAQGQQAVARREADFADFARRRDYEVAHPTASAPTEFERLAMASGVQPGTPEWAALAKRKVDNSLDPQVTVQLPSGGLYMGRQSGLATAIGGGSAAPPSAPVGRLTPMQGGATPGGSRSFPIR